MPIPILKNPSCKFWHPPVCQIYKSEKGCVYGDKCHIQHVEAERKPNKKSKKCGAKGSAAILKESVQWNCVFQDSYLRNYVNKENWDRNTPSSFVVDCWSDLSCLRYKPVPSALRDVAVPAVINSSSASRPVIQGLDFELIFAPLTSRRSAEHSTRSTSVAL